MSILLAFDHVGVGIAIDADIRHMGIVDDVGVGVVYLVVVGAV